MAFSLTPGVGDKMALRMNGAGGTQGWPAGNDDTEHSRRRCHDYKFTVRAENVNEPYDGHVRPVTL